MIGSRSAAPDPTRERHARAFEAAWREFTQECVETVAPEATYQAWLAHFTMTRLGPLHVVREVDFGARHLSPEAATSFKPVGNLMLDMVILRQPLVSLPRRATLGLRDLPPGPINPRSGLGRLADFSVITELKVSATQIVGIKQGQVIRDFQKLSAILRAAESAYPNRPLPAAYVGVFANSTRPRFNFDLLRRRLAEADLHPALRMASFDVRTGEATFEGVS